MDWIKVEKSTPRKPEVLRLGAILGIHPDHAFGLCVRFWMWCDEQLQFGCTFGVTGSMIDALLAHNGFADALVEVGWLQVRSGSLAIPNFDRHLSENAKKRAISRKSMAKSRSKARCRESATFTQPEKRREEKINTPIPPEGFAEFWKIFPRKVGRQAAEKAWGKIRPDPALLSRILSAVEAQSRTQAWTKDGGQFIPHAATWLNGKRWEDEIHVVTPPPSLFSGKTTVELMREREASMEVK